MGRVRTTRLALLLVLGSLTLFVPISAAGSGERAVATQSDPDDIDQGLDLRRATFVGGGDRARVVVRTFNRWRCRDLPPAEGLDPDENYSLEWRFEDPEGESALGFFVCDSERGILFRITPELEYESPQFDFKATRLSKRHVRVGFPLSTLRLDTRRFLTLRVRSQPSEVLTSSVEEADVVRPFRWRSPD